MRSLFDKMRQHFGRTKCARRVRFALRRIESILPGAPIQRRVPAGGPFLYLCVRQRDESFVRQNAAAFWTHEVRLICYLFLPGALLRVFNRPIHSHILDGSMSYTLSTKQEDDLLVVEIGGQRTKGELVRHASVAWTEITSLCHERGLSRLLIISRATGEYSTTNAYRINSQLSEWGVRPGWRIAFVNLDSESLANMQFGETVAVNRGFDLKVFDNVDDARKWLSNQ